jgi:hypothetical protein
LNRRNDNAGAKQFHRLEPRGLEDHRTIFAQDDVEILHRLLG